MWGSLANSNRLKSIALPSTIFLGSDGKICYNLLHAVSSLSLHGMKSSKIFLSTSLNIDNCHNFDSFIGVCVNVTRNNETVTQEVCFRWFKILHIRSSDYYFLFRSRSILSETSSQMNMIRNIMTIPQKKTLCFYPNFCPHARGKVLKYTY